MAKVDTASRKIGVRFNIDPGVLAKLDALAEESGRTRSDLLRRMVDDFVERGGEDIEYERLVDQGLLEATEEAMAEGGRRMPLAEVRARYGL
ncbi:MAG: ribbon-helix-helix protein, CopG family [Armatimonadetes bacterium]|nr:ribbon-helix-helix protein, CopG family [Armatimonadota bacterium]